MSIVHQHGVGFILSLRHSPDTVGLRWLFIRAEGKWLANCGSTSAFGLLPWANSVRAVSTSKLSFALSSGHQRAAVGQPHFDIRLMVANQIGHQGFSVNEYEVSTEASPRSRSMRTISR